MAAPRGDNVKEQILAAAMELLQSRPDVSLAEIAAAAHVSKGTLFYHYKSKGDIYLDIGERYWDKLSDDLLAWVDNREKDTSPPRLVRYTMQRGVFDESGPLRLHLFTDAISQGSEGEAIRTALIVQYTHFKNILKTRIQERIPGADGENTAWLLLTLVDGLMVQYSLKNPEIDINRFIEWLATAVPRFPQ
jgi:AcrR family transcriptional regulator